MRRFLASGEAGYGARNHREGSGVGKRAAIFDELVNGAVYEGAVETGIDYNRDVAAQGEISVDDDLIIDPAAFRSRGGQVEFICVSVQRERPVVRHCARY